MRGRVNNKFESVDDAKYRISSSAVYDNFQASVWSRFFARFIDFLVTSVCNSIRSYPDKMLFNFRICRSTSLSDSKKPFVDYSAKAPSCQKINFHLLCANAIASAICEYRGECGGVLCPCMKLKNAKCDNRKQRRFDLISERASIAQLTGASEKIGNAVRNRVSLTNSESPLFHFQMDNSFFAGVLVLYTWRDDVAAAVRKRCLRVHSLLFYRH